MWEYGDYAWERRGYVMYGSTVSEAVEMGLVFL